MSSLYSSISSNASIPFSARRYIDDIPADKRSELCTEIDYTIHQNEGYWQNLVSKLGFDETRSKKFRLSFEMHGSPTDNLLRDCSHKMVRIRQLYKVMKEIGLVQLAEEILGEFDTDDSSSVSLYPKSHNTVPCERKFSPGIHKAMEAKSSSSKASWIGIETKHYAYEDIKRGTNNFSSRMELGAGAFGKVYKVILTKTTFACKVLKIDTDNPLTTCIIETHRQHDDLRNELNYLAEYRHPNIIPLYGWSLDGPDPCLIYHYMENGSLQDRLQCLNGSKPMKWETRVKVSRGAAIGLQFLHTMKSKPLIHGDIKTANILLDESYTAKLGDFGLAREMPRNSSTGSYIKLGNEHTPGTLGYLANEYISTKKLSVQVDTFAFGVVLLELYTGRRAFDRNKETPLLRDFVDNIASDIDEIGLEKTEEKLMTLQDPQIPAFPKKSLALKYVRLALQCCHEKRTKRPKMDETLQQLEAIDDYLTKMAKRSNHHYNPDMAGPSSNNEETGTLPRREYIEHAKRKGITDTGSQLSRDPVESVDHSLIGDTQAIQRKLSREGQHNRKEASPSNLMSKLDLKNSRFSSSSDSDSQDRSSIDTTNSDVYYPHRGGHYPANPPGYTPRLPYYMQPKAKVINYPQYQYPNPLGGDLYGAGYNNNQNGIRPTSENPFGLDLSRARRVSPQQISPGTQWDNYPGNFNSMDLDSESQSYLPSDETTIDQSTNEMHRSNFFQSSPSFQSSKQGYETGDSLDSHQGMLSNLPPPNLYSGSNLSSLGGYSLNSSATTVSLNPVKESIMDKLRNGETSYTQIFSNTSRVATESDGQEEPSYLSRR